MPANRTLIFHVALDAKVFREIEIAASASLYKLGQAIVSAFGFDFDHAFGYYDKLTGSYYKSAVKYELFTDMGEPTDGALSVKKTTVATAFPVDGAKYLFIFDYGDEWKFVIERTGTGVKAAGTKYPRVVKSTGKAPEQYPQWEE